MVLRVVVVAVAFVAGDDGGWLWLWGGVFVDCLVGCGFWVWCWRGRGWLWGWMVEFLWVVGFVCGGGGSGFCGWW